MAPILCHVIFRDSIFIETNVWFISPFNYPIQIFIFTRDF